MATRTEEEIRMERILDQMDLERLEHERQITDMDGWREKKSRNRWSFRRPELGLTKRLYDDTVDTPLEEGEGE